MNHVENNITLQIECAKPNLQLEITKDDEIRVHWQVERGGATRMPSANVLHSSVVLFDNRLARRKTKYGASV